MSIIDVIRNENPVGGYLQAVKTFQPLQRSRVVERVDTSWSQSSTWGGSDVPTYPLSWQGWPDRQDNQGNIYSQTINDPKMKAMIALQSSWVFSNINVIAQEFSTANLTIKRKGKKGKLKEIQDHEFTHIWNYPNPYLGRGFIAEFWCWQLLLFGKAFLFFAPDQTGSIAEIWPIPSAYFHPVQRNGNFIDGYVWKQGEDSKPIFVPAEYICYSRSPHPFDLLRGMGPLESGMTAIQSDLAQQKWNRDFFSKDNALPQAIITTSPEISPSDFKRFKAELFDFYGGGQRRTMVAPGGQVDVNLLSMGQKEMDFIGSRNFSQGEIDRLFNVPGGFWTSNATEANARHAKAILIEMAVWPKIEKLSEDLKVQIVNRHYDESDIVEFDDIRPRNIELDIRLSDSRLKRWTINELRAEDGLEPLEDEIFDIVPAEVALAKWQPEIEEVEIDDPFINKEEKPELIGLDKSTPNSDLEDIKQEVDNFKSVILDKLDLLQSAFQLSYKSNPEESNIKTDIMQEKYTKWVDEAIKWQRKSRKSNTDIADFKCNYTNPLIEKRIREGRLSFDDVIFSNSYKKNKPKDEELRQKRESTATKLFIALGKKQLEALKEFITKHIEEASLTFALDQFWKDESPAVTNTLLDFFDDTLVLAAQGGIDALPSFVVSYEQVNQDVLALAQAKAAESAKEYVESSKAAADIIIANWIEVGGSLPDLLKRVERVYPETKGEVYAITQVTNLFAQGNRIAWKNSDIVSKFTFNSVYDKRVCVVCEPYNQKEYDLDDDEHMPAIHYRCRCFITPVVDE